MGPVSMALYRGIAVPALRLGLAVMAPFHQKLAQRRREEASSWDRARLQLTSDSRPRIWFHAASMGELEQLLPIIERVRLLQPPLCIVTTCTSPSGRSHAAKQKSIDHALYLPVDNWRSLNEFVDVVRPTLVVIDRYDVWPVMVSTLHKRRIRTMLVNATLPSGANVPLLRGFTQRLYAMLDEIIAVTPEDAQAFSGLLAREVAWLPDTRMDRVLEKRATLQNVSSGLPQWHGKTLVLGSTWPDDERMMLEAWLAITPPGWRMIIVPHEPTEEALASIERRLPCVRLSRAQNVSDDRSPHVLVDSVGMLLQLYAIADAA